MNVRYLPKVIPNTDDIYEQLQKQVEWQVILWGPTKRILSRLCSNKIGESQIAQVLSKWVEQYFYQCMGIQCTIEGMFGNRYRNGLDWLPDHKDNYGDLHVVSLSFGVTRKFHFKKNNTITNEYDLQNGDMIIFSSHNDYIHGIKKQPNVLGERINITIFCRFIGNPYTATIHHSLIESSLNVISDEEMARRLQEEEWV